LRYLAIAAGELDGRQLLNGDLVVGGGAEEVLIPLRYQVQRIRRPMLGHYANAVRLRIDGFKKRLRERLPEGEGT